MSLISILAVSFAIQFALLTLNSLHRSPGGQVSLRVGDDGTVYNTVQRQIRPNPRFSHETAIFAAKAPRIPLADPLPEIESPHTPPESTRLREMISLDPMQSDQLLLLAHHQASFSIDRSPAVYHRDGYYLLYDSVTSRLRGRIVRPNPGDGIVAFDDPNPGLIPLLTKSAEKYDEPMSLQARSIEATANPAPMGGLICDRNGVYWLRADPGPATLLLDTEVDAVGTVYRGTDGSQQQLWLLAGQRLTAYDISIDEELSQSGGENSAASSEEPTRSAQLRPKQNYSLPPEFGLDDESAPRVSLYPLRDGGLVVVATHNPARSSVAHYFPSSELRESYAVARYRETEPVFPHVVETSTFPPAAVWIGRAVMLVQEWLTDGRSREDAYRIVPDRTWQIAMLLTMIHALFGSVLAWVTCRRRDLSRNTTAGWTVLGALFGVGTGLAVLASYPRPTWALCGRCVKPARVDSDRCLCGAFWEPPPTIGIEILESDSRSTPAMAGNG